MGPGRRTQSQISKTEEPTSIDGFCGATSIAMHRSPTRRESVESAQILVPWRPVLLVLYPSPSTILSHRDHRYGVRSTQLPPFPPGGTPMPGGLHRHAVVERPWTEIRTRAANLGDPKQDGKTTQLLVNRFDRREARGTGKTVQRSSRNEAGDPRPVGCFESVPLVPIRRPLVRRRNGSTSFPVAEQETRTHGERNKQTLETG